MSMDTKSKMTPAQHVEQRAFITRVGVIGDDKNLHSVRYSRKLIAQPLFNTGRCYFEAIIERFKQLMFIPSDVTNVFEGEKTHCYDWTAIDISPVALGVPLKKVRSKAQSPRIRIKASWTYQFMLMQPTLLIKLPKGIFNPDIKLLILHEETAAHLSLITNVSNNLEDLLLKSFDVSLNNKMRSSIIASKNGFDLVELLVRQELQDTSESQLKYESVGDYDE